MGLGRIAAASLRLLLVIATIARPCMTCFFSNIRLTVHQPILALFKCDNSGSLIHLIHPEVSRTQVRASADTRGRKPRFHSTEYKDSWRSFGVLGKSCELNTMDKLDEANSTSKSLHYSIPTLLWIGHLCATNKTPFDLSRLSFAVFHGKNVLYSDTMSSL